MSQKTTKVGIYKLFGVDKYANKLEIENSEKKLGQLDRILTKYILSKAVDDLSDKDLEKLEAEKPKNGQEVYNFLNKCLTDFSDKLSQYGKEFKRDYARYGITS